MLGPEISMTFQVAYRGRMLDFLLGSPSPSSTTHVYFVHGYHEIIWERLSKLSSNNIPWKAWWPSLSRKDSTSVTSEVWSLCDCSVTNKIMLETYIHTLFQSFVGIPYKAWVACVFIVICCLLREKSYCY